MAAKDPIINCHTHIFTGDHVPPYLAKTFLPGFIQWLVSLRLIIFIFRKWYKGPYKWQFKPWYKRIAQLAYKTKVTISRYILLDLFYWVFGIWLTLQVFYWFFESISIHSEISDWVSNLLSFLEARGLFMKGLSFFSKLLLFLILWMIFPTGRNVAFFLLKKIYSFLNILPGKLTRELAQRYLNIGRFAFYNTQAGIFRRLSYQYPAGTAFIILPMDMEYMDAGKVKSDFAAQMKDLKKLKKALPNTVFPFIFIDPRRMNSDDSFLKFKRDVNGHLIVNRDGKIQMDDCMIKEYIEVNNFSGFKIYPALGYYPFDESLLLLWLYAAQNDIPIMTHCIKGTIFYRGKKHVSWDQHPIFKQSAGNKEYIPLLLPEMDNKDFSINFTHPLNYLCLLEEELLKEVLSQKNISIAIKNVFGFKSMSQPLEKNLADLKICFAHFGGDDEWNRYFELDRDNYSTQIIKNQDVGIRFLTGQKGEKRPGKIEQLWKYTDWYSIICSMMIQFPNVYSDISYIAHNNNIHSLLKRTLAKSNTKLRTRVLFGTDFYVVRNHKSEKQILADTIAGLTEEEFDLIARINPRSYLSI